MAELIATSPMGLAAPLVIGSVTLSEADLGQMTTLAPYIGQEGALSKAMKAAHGVKFPAPGRSEAAEGTRAVWFGREMALLVGPAPDAGLAAIAALTDQSDAFACAELSGTGAEAVLAYLVPVDLRAGAFPEGRTARSLLKHMNVSITRTGADRFLILAYRSMAGTLLHDLQRAMERVAARG